MIKKIFLLLLFTLLLVNCKKELQDADVIVRKSIEVSGGERFKNSTIGFEFRGRHYSASRNEGEFSLSRLTITDSDSVFDILSNHSFDRYINGERIVLADSMATKYSASVNSVHYFSVLPYGLDNKAVKRAYLGKTKVKGRDYYKIKITFNEDGGGEDFEDVFIYWINTKTFKADYLAYSYEENHDLGLRFREAYNERFIEGIRFVDYNNYKPKDNDEVLENLDLKFENDALELLSKIELEHVLVSI
tara:strand:- start:881 stop:1621 length:741 start_codon:yes stop_codon:yes gene_type:complete